MKTISLFVGDNIRMQPNELTVDGLAIAVEPFIILPLDATDETLADALRTCLGHARNGAHHRPWQAEETKAYYRKLGVRSQKDLGDGVEISPDGDEYIITPVDRRGAFGEARQVEKKDLLPVVKELLALDKVAG